MRPSCTIPVTCSNILDLKSFVIIPLVWNLSISIAENTHSLYRLLAGFAFHFGEKSILCRIFPHMSASISQSSATKDMTPLLPVTFHGAESPWMLVPVSTIWFAMVRIRLYLTDDVISRFNRHRFKTSPLFDPLGSLELLHLLWQCLWMSEFMKIQGYFNDNSAAVTKEEGRAGRRSSGARALLHRSDFLPDRLTAEWIPVDGQKLRALVCLQRCCCYWSVNMTCLRIAHRHGNNKQGAKFH